MAINNNGGLKHVYLDSDKNHKESEVASLGAEVTQIQHKSAIQKKVLAEQAMQIYSLIAELRERDSKIAAS